MAVNAMAIAAAGVFGPAGSQGAQSVTAAIDYHSQGTAISRMCDDSASNLEQALDQSRMSNLRRL